MAGPESEGEDHRKGRPGGGRPCYSRSVRRLFGGGLEVYGGEFAAIVHFNVEGKAVALFETGEAGALDRGDVDKGVRLSVIAGDEAEALGHVEEFDRARRAFAGQMALAARALRAAAAAPLHPPRPEIRTRGRRAGEKWVYTVK